MQRDGIAVPDGIVLEPRMYQVFPYQNRDTKKTIQVRVASDGHYIAMPYADTTYSIPMTWPSEPHYSKIFDPVITHLEFPTMPQRPKPVTCK